MPSAALSSLEQRESGGGVLAIYYLLAGAVLLVAIDALRQPAYRWAEADKNKAFWVTNLLFGAWLAPIGVVVAFIYVTSIRSQMGSGQTGTAYATFVSPDPVEAIEIAPAPRCTTCDTALRGRERFCPACGHAVGTSLP
jgi:hypothetical protein